MARARRHPGSRSAPKRRKATSGFTLLEVMAALAVLAVALAAGIKAASSQVSNVAYLQERTLAHWVAMNKMAELEIFDEYPSPGSRDRGTMLLAEHEWHWEVEAEDSDDLQGYKVGVVYVRVRRSEDSEQTLATLIGAYPQ